MTGTTLFTKIADWKLLENVSRNNNLVWISKSFKNYFIKNYILKGYKKIFLKTDEDFNRFNILNLENTILV